MKKKVLSILSLIILITALFTQTLVFADTNISSNIITYTQRNEFSGEYLDLSNISVFDIYKNKLIYSDGSSLYYYNLKTHTQIAKYDSFENISYIKLSKDYVFILKNSELKIYNLTNFSLVSIKDKSNANLTLPNNISSIAINPTSSQITICYVSNNILTRMYLSTSLSIIGDITNSEDVFKYTGQITLSNSDVYVICGDTETNLNKLCKIDLNSLKNFSYSYFPLLDCVHLAVISSNSVDYLIAVFKKDLQKVAIINSTLQEGVNSKADFETGNNAKNKNDVFELGLEKLPISTPTDVKIINSDIYLSDSTTKTIQKFNIDFENEKAKLVGNSIVCASEFANKGWFSTGTTLAVKSGTEFYVADRKNNRVQIVKNNVLTNIIDCESPSNITYSNSTLFFTSSNASGAKLIKIKNNNTETIDSILNNSSKITNIYSGISDYLGNYYALTNLGVLKYDANSSYFKVIESLISPIINSDSKIVCLDYYNSFAVLTNNTLYLLNKDFNVSDSIELSNISSICSNLNTIYALHNDGKIIKINVENKNYSLNFVQNKESISDSRFNSLSFLTINSETGVLYGFDYKKCSIETILDCGFNLIDMNKKAITLNKNVYVYSKPTTLPLTEQNSSVVIGNINIIGSTIDLYSTEEIIFEGNKFYAIKYRNKVCFINVNDVDLFTSSKIIYFEPANACVKGKNNVSVYNSPELNDENIIYTLTPESTFITINYNESDEFTKIKFYDKNNQLKEGYIETKSIDPYSLTRAEITAITLIAVSIPMAIILICLYVKISKSKTKKSLK